MRASIVKISLLLTALYVLMACSSASVISSQQGPSIVQAASEPTHGVKRRIAVKPFSYKASSGGSAMARGLSLMMADALFNTGEFIVLERERIGDLIEEQDLADAGRFRRDTTAPKGQLEGAEWIVRGAVTEFEPKCRGGSLLLIGGRQACIGINIRIIEVKTGRVINSTSVRGTSGSGGIGLVFTRSVVPIGLGAWSKTPVEQAMRQCIEKAVQHIVAHKLQ